MLKTKVADWYNARKREPLLSDCKVEIPTDPEAPPAERQLSALERRALCSLAARDQRVLRARLLWNWSFGQIGKDLGLGDDGARKAYQRALGRLKKRCDYLRAEEGLPEDPEARWWRALPPLARLGVWLAWPVFIDRRTDRDRPALAIAMRTDRLEGVPGEKCFDLR